MIFRKATRKDIECVAAIYAGVCACDAQGLTQVGWRRDIYPTKLTAEAALARGDLFVAEQDGEIVGTAIINQVQVDVYAGASWSVDAAADEVMVLHTLAISPNAFGRGYGKAFVEFYEQYALENGCRHLRMDTNRTNARARAMYKMLGYTEIGIVPCKFNGIDGIELVLLEKEL